MLEYEFLNLFKNDTSSFYKISKNNWVSKNKYFWNTTVIRHGLNSGFIRYHIMIIDF